MTLRNINNANTIIHCAIGLSKPASVKNPFNDTSASLSVPNSHLA